MRWSKPLPQFTQAHIDKFWANVDVRGPDECWPWAGQVDSKSGYGKFWADGVSTCYLKSHRVAYRLQHGEDPYPLDVMHSCDNPPCCNGKHLSKGTHNDNMQDAKRKGRIASGESSGMRKHPERHVRGTQVHTAILTEEQVMEMRREFHAGLKTSQREAARRHEMSWSNYRCAIVLQTSWSHLPPY